MHGQPYTPEEKQYISEYFFSKTLKQIGKELGRTEHSVRNQARKQKLIKKTAPLTPEEKRLIKAEAGILSRAEIMAKHNVTKNQLNYLKVNMYRTGERHQSAKYSDAFVEECRDLYDEGYSIKEISVMKKVHYQTVASWLKFQCRTGIKINS